MTEAVVASVVYITCPQATTVVGSAMGYVFAIEILATAFFVSLFVLATGGSCHSAWDNTRAILRTELATDAAESTALLREERRLGSNKIQVEEL